MQPLLEVFGFPLDDQSSEAIRHRQSRLCPFGNVSPNCTKDKVSNPLGVCSINCESGNAIVCPVRFRERGLVAETAARFFFGESASWAVIPEVRLKDKMGRAAGNIDMVIVSYDAKGCIQDFGAVEIQSVYISGNIRNPFEFYLSNSKLGSSFDWSNQKNYPRPDYLSSSRKRLAPQLLYKGGILRAWGKKLVVALDTGFMHSLPALTNADEKHADIAWCVFELKHDLDAHSQLRLALSTIHYSEFSMAMDELTITEAGPIEDFIMQLQSKLNRLNSSAARKGIVLE